MILDGSGKTVGRINEDVKKYVWSPDGTRLAFLTFEPCDCDYSFKCASGVWVFDIKAGAAERVADRAYYLNWASFDNNIYYYDHKNVFKYSPATAGTSETLYHGVNFSPDGKYYTTSSVEQDYNVYLTATNEPVTERLRARFKKWTYMPSWNLAYTHHLQVTEIEHLTSPADAGQQVRVSLGIKQKRHALYDVEQDVVISEWIEVPDE